LHDRRRSVLWWSVGVVGLVLFTVALFPSVRGQESFEELANELPEALRSLFSFDEAVPLTSAPGYLQGRLFASMLPLVLLVFGIGLGARAIAGSEQDGTLELLLANPVTRRAVVVQRYLALLTMIAALTLVFAISLVVLGAPFGALDDVSLVGLAGACVGAFGITVLHATVAFAVGAATGRRAFALAAATTLAVAGYLLQGLLGLSDAVQPLRFVSPWHWYLGRNMLAQGVATDAIVVPLLVAAVMFAAGAAAFLRRDLR
ncbi:MAG TPA: ABC transporter permease subunit, partial [Acidimicrobiales bacterium]|nr:ABC transporter permease subunit [Acidimicrobiales bacterium]